MMAKKIITFFLAMALMGINFFIFPQKSQAIFVPVSDPVHTAATKFQTATFSWKEFAGDIAARVLGRNLLTRLSNQVIAKIQTGGRQKGKEKTAAFVQNWRDFILQGQYRGENVFRGILYEALNETAGGQGVICPQFKDQIGQIFGAKKVNLKNVSKRVNSSQSFAVTAKCSLPKNVDDFYGDFSKGGGWETFLRTLEPQNTLAGVIALSSGEMEKQRELEEKSDLNEAISGSGFTGLRSGCEGSVFEDEDPDNDFRCTVLGKIVTPSSFLSESVKNTINTEFDWLTNSDEISEILGGVVNAIINRTTNEILNRKVGLSKIKNIGEENAAPESFQTPTPEPTPTQEAENSACYSNCIVREISACPAGDQVCINSVRDTCNQECGIQNP